MHAGNYDPMTVNTFCLFTGPDLFSWFFSGRRGFCVGQTASLLKSRE